MKKRRLLDSFAMLAFLNAEGGSERVLALLRTAEASGEPLLMNEINVGEVYYVTAKRRSPDHAEAFLLGLESLPIEIARNSFAEVLEAARIKARFPLSYADAFAVATAVRMDASIVTGDREFQAVEHVVDIVWM